MTRKQAKLAHMVYCSYRAKLGVCRIQDTQQFYLVDYDETRNRWYSLHTEPMTRQSAVHSYFSAIRYTLGKEQ